MSDSTGAEMTVVHAHWGDEYTGTADQLIAAGLVQAEQLPGAPGIGKIQATFYKGVYGNGRKSRGNGAWKDEHYLCVSRKSRTMFQVLRGISQKEGDRRNAEERARRERERVQDARRPEVKAPEDPDMCRRYALLPLRMLRHTVTGQGPCKLPETAFRLPETPGSILVALDQIEEWLMTAPLRPMHEFQRTLALVRNDGTLQEFTQAQGQARRD